MDTSNNILKVARLPNLQEPLAAVLRSTLAQHVSVVDNPFGVSIIICQFCECRNFAACKQSYAVQEHIAPICEHRLYDKIPLAGMVDKSGHVPCKSHSTGQ